MPRSNNSRYGFLIRPAISGAVLAAMLAAGLPAVAGEGGDPANRISLFERVKASKAKPAPEVTKKVVKAAAPSTPTKRFHDKTDAEWLAYHQEMREFQRRNTGR